MIENILRVWNTATRGEREHGMGWYRRSHNEVKRRLYGVPTRTACGIVACLSPQTAWARNIRMAQQLWLTGNCGSTRHRVTKARAIVGGEDPRDVLNGTTRNHGKERAFYECLLDPDNRVWACVDGHAYAVAIGHRIATSATPRFNYGEIELAYLRAADAAGVLPSQLQATTWLAWRRLHGVRREVDRDEHQLYLPFMAA